MAAEWFLAREGQQTVGPLTGQQLKQLAAAGQVQATHLVWKQGMAKWVPASQVKGLLGGSGEMPSAVTLSGVSVPVGTAEPPPPAEEQPAAAPPAPAPADTFTLASGDEDDRSARGREPWYFGFLEKYALVALWLGVGVCAFGFVWFLFVGVTAFSLLGERAGGFALATVVLSIVVGLLVLGLGLLAILFQVALILLAVDAARNLRSIRGKLGKR